MRKALISHRREKVHCKILVTGFQPVKPIILYSPTQIRGCPVVLKALIYTSNVHRTVEKSLTQHQYGKSYCRQLSGIPSAAVNCQDNSKNEYCYPKDNGPTTRKRFYLPTSSVYMWQSLSPICRKPVLRLRHSRRLSAEEGSSPTKGKMPEPHLRDPDEPKFPPQAAEKGNSAYSRTGQEIPGSFRYATFC